jgi:hypothetical protein
LSKLDDLRKELANKQQELFATSTGRRTPEQKKLLREINDLQRKIGDLEEEQRSGK